MKLIISDEYKEPTELEGDTLIIHKIRHTEYHYSGFVVTLKPEVITENCITLYNGEEALLLNEVYSEYAMIKIEGNIKIQQYAESILYQDLGGD